MEFFNLENPLPMFSTESLNERLISLFDNEFDHMPSFSTYPPPQRNEIVSLILIFSPNFDPFLSYLAINYLDRFLSTQQQQQPISKEEKLRVPRLVAISCLSLAMKMKKSNSVSQIQHDGGIIFDSRSIERMELLILSSLKWRMRSITPFCFINFFISLFKFKDLPSTNALKARATEIIFKAQNDIKLLHFRPSIISSSALLSASHELFPLQFQSFQNSILNCSFVNKENFGMCHNVVQEIAMEGYESVMDMVSSSNTPANVLDLQYFSGTSSSDNEQSRIKKMINGDEEEEARGIATFRLEKDLKRRKIGGFFRSSTVSTAG